MIRRYVMTMSNVQVETKGKLIYEKRMKDALPAIFLPCNLDLLLQLMRPPFTDRVPVITAKLLALAITGVL